MCAFISLSKCAQCIYIAVRCTNIFFFKKLYMFWLNSWPASSSPEKQYLFVDVSQKYKPHFRRKRLETDSDSLIVEWNTSDYLNSQTIMILSDIYEIQQRKCYFFSLSKQLNLFLTSKLSTAYTTVWAITKSRLPPPPNCTALCYLLSAHSNDHWSVKCYLLRAMAVDQDL